MVTCDGEADRKIAADQQAVQVEQSGLDRRTTTAEEWQ
jgi:hypothetical protein